MTDNPGKTGLRTHHCGELRKSDVGREVTLCAWVANRRDHGGIFFVDLRDRYGITQVTVDPEHEGVDASRLEEMAQLKAEDVVRVRGRVIPRPDSQVNKERATGEIEVLALEIELLRSSETPPIDMIDDCETSVDVRLKYRFLDLRRRPMMDNLLFRSRFSHAIREHLVSRDFIEVETPILTRATPEGARDYVVPSRVHPGEWYALPQSPQIFKQILQVSGVDKYFQIARCFRDEDLRADRQPEFTQLDLEMSFVDEDDVFAVMEGVMQHAFREAVGVELQLPFPRMSYEEAMRRFGSDKPDLRFGMELVDVSELVAGCEFKVFTGALESGGQVKAICVEGGAEYSRKQIEALTEFAKEFGAKGLAWAKVDDKGELTGSIGRWFGGEAGTGLRDALGAKTGDLLLFAADSRQVVARVLGELRRHLAKERGLLDPKEFSFLWVTEFPLFEYSEERERFESSHHPFTAPVDWDVDFTKDPGSIKSRAYDLVLNGWELGSGSVRIHRQDVQDRLFAALGLSKAEADEKFGFLLSALQYGAPPHAGFAIGLDRSIALARGMDSIRDIVPFPKTTSAADLMTGAPSEIAPEQLGELSVQVKRKG
ncbi:MAG: aspartate--tRNA ligase [Planctomycetota bacterium]|nr:MAG: aspartate--tRNA ligase [Planctomycetota bacterium]